MKLVKTFVIYKSKLSSTLLAELFINRLKTKFNSVFLQNGFKYKGGTAFDEISLEELNKIMLSTFIVGKKMRRPLVWSLRAKIVIVGNSKNELKIIIFVLNYLTVVVYSKTVICLSVGG